MWLLIWFQLENGVSHFEVGQYPSEKICFEERQRASILVTKTNEYLYCFKVSTGD
jgi:hypothetical protein